MMRRTTRGLALLGLLTLAASTARAQNFLADRVEVRNPKDGTVASLSGLLKTTPTGFYVYTGDKVDKPGEPFNPDDIVSVTVSEMPGVDGTALREARDKEAKKTAKDYAEALAKYEDLKKKSSAAPERGKRFLAYKVAALKQRLADDLDPGKDWEEKADAAISEWKGFVADYEKAFGWEVWPAVRALTRAQIERGKVEDAAQTWSRLKAVADLPPAAKLEAALQEIDLRIRSKAYPNAAIAADELLKTATAATAAQKARLAVYSAAAKAGSGGKPLDGIKGVEAEMAKSKDPAVLATGYAMMGELYLAAGQPRDAMWMFLWVETVMNQDKDEVFKAVVRLADIFETKLPDEEQAKKYREKLKRLRDVI